MSKKHTLNNIQKMALDKEGECLSNEYRGGPHLSDSFLVGLRCKSQAA